MELKDGAYRPQAIKRVWIPKPGRPEKRPLGIPTVRDRVVQTALRAVLEPIFERDFADHSYGFRPGRGCKDALREVDGQLKSGNAIVVDADLKSFFDTIPKDRLMKLVSVKISDGRVLALVEAYLNQSVLDGLEEWTPAEGTPQGAIISPLLANIYLNPLDHLMAKAGYTMVRYADDFVILCPSQEDAEQALKTVESWTQEAGLKLHPDKTKIVYAAQPGGFDFLGYHFERGQRRPRDKSRKKLKDAIRGKTMRTNSFGLMKIISDANPTLRGWFEYFKHSHKHTFEPLDGWIRMRLRSILRKRDKRKGRETGLDHLRWPNSFFAKLGLFSLTKAYEMACQSARR
jgi:RNA-directed DNA polymerase